MDAIPHGDVCNTPGCQGNRSHFTAYSVDTNVPVRLRLKILLGITAGNIWSTHEMKLHRQLVGAWCSVHGERRPGNHEEDFSQGSDETKYR